MATPLGTGVIGLGPLWWKIYRPALRSLSSLFEVCSVYDHVHATALREARRLRAEAAAGVTALLEREDVQVVLLLDEQWFGLWPLEAACRFGKPVFCAGSLEREGDRAETLVQKVRDSQLPVMMAFAPRFAPATDRLRDLLQHDLGPARLLLCEAVRPPSQPLELLPALDLCASLIGSEPERVTSFGCKDAGFGGLFLEFGDGRAAQVTSREEPGGRTSLQLHVVAERGTATVHFPDRLQWMTQFGRHAQKWSGPGNVGAAMLEAFWQAVTDGAPSRTGVEEAYRALCWLTAAGPEQGKKATQA